MSSGNTQSNASLRPTIWQKALYQDVIDNLYFTKNGMMGTDDNNIVQIKDGLMKEKGNTVTFGLTAKLSGAGVTGDSELEGNEEKINSYAESVVISKKRFAVRLDGKLDELTDQLVHAPASPHDPALAAPAAAMIQAA